jgi:hypothetical protein
VTRRRKIIIALGILAGIVFLSMLVPVIQYAIDNADRPVETMAAFTPDPDRGPPPTFTIPPYPVPTFVTVNPYPKPDPVSPTPYP